MRVNDRILYNVPNQTHLFRVHQGRPDASPAPTCFVSREYMTDDATPEWCAAGAVVNGITYPAGGLVVDAIVVTADTYTQSLTSAAGPGQSDPAKIIPASTSGLVTDGSRQYQIRENAMKEWVTLNEVESGYVRARNSLKNNYTTAAVLESTYLSLAISNVWIASKVKVNVQPDPNPGYRVIWTYYVNGVQYTAYSFLTVVRARMPHSVIPSDIAARAHGFMDTMPVEFRAEDGRPLIDAAYAVVQADMATFDVNPDAFRDTQLVDEMVILKTLALLADGGWKPLGYSTLAEYRKTTHDNYDRFVEQRLKVSMKPRIAFGIAGEAETVFAEPSWSK